jgi:hypothetical protein
MAEANKVKYSNYISGKSVITSSVIVIFLSVYIMSTYYVCTF